MQVSYDARLSYADGLGVNQKSARLVVRVLSERDLHKFPRPPVVAAADYSCHKSAQLHCSSLGVPDRSVRDVAAGTCSDHRELDSILVEVDYSNCDIAAAGIRSSLDHCCDAMDGAVASRTCDRCLAPPSIAVDERPNVASSIRSIP